MIQGVNHIPLAVSDLEQSFVFYSDILGGRPLARQTMQVRQWKQNTSKGDSLYILEPEGHQLGLHCGHWRPRLAATQAAPYQDMEFFP